MTILSRVDFTPILGDDLLPSSNEPHHIFPRLSIPIGMGHGNIRGNRHGSETSAESGIPAHDLAIRGSDTS